MDEEVKQEHKVLPCGCRSTKAVDLYPYFRFIQYCDQHAKEHGTDVNVETAFVDNSPKFVETDADVERIANYLKKGNVANTFEICEALGMKGIIVALSLKRLTDAKVVGVTSDNPHKFFFNP